MEDPLADHLDRDRESDYGSDFTPDEELLLSQLLQTSPSTATLKPDSDLDVKLRGDLENENIRHTAISHTTGQGPRDTGAASWKVVARTKRTSISLEGYGSTYTDLEKRISRPERQSIDSSDVRPSNTPKQEVPDLRSPLERFRTKPKKPLSVTDLVSPAWCELQYWYSLTKHGKKRRTPAMKQGSVVHKTLEDQVHRTVPVDVQTKEDAWGLRIWNAIQGLRTLRETGMTRELEIWGAVDGLVVNGVVDELSYICPDRELEEKNGPGLIERDALPADQKTIQEFFPPAFAQQSWPPVVKDVKSLGKKTSRIYLTDVKTRMVNSVPRGPAFRPTLMQLMLYHRLISDLATDRIDPAVIFDRYSLDPAQNFSDAFIAQFGNLNGTFHEALSDVNSSPESSFDLTGSQDTVQLLLDHNCLNKLWALMIQEYQQTMIDGAASVGNVLKVEYRAQRDGSILGVKTFLYDHDVIQSYLEDEIRWWRGEREVQGVCEAEAYKCGSCEFAEECTWRKEKILEATERHRTRTRSVV